MVVEDFVLNATLLSNEHLGKQRIEAKQIIDTILGITKGWRHHPAVRAWEPFVIALKYYANCCIDEWIRRGKKNTLPHYELPPGTITMPWWVKWDRLHQSHRAMLFRKNPFYYGDKFTVEQEYTLYGYIWPHSVDYENKNKPLSEITAPIPDNLINPVFCKSVLKSGIRKGQSVKLRPINLLIIHGG
ncbi:MAG: hypothetical protein MUO21_01655, partial [Nitrososphaeraceae archaeon]|nr:hypothetical protein [Nitrososphaeraceae archaeon]